MRFVLGVTEATRRPVIDIVAGCKVFVLAALNFYFFTGTAAVKLGLFATLLSGLCKVVLIGVIVLRNPHDYV